MKPEDSFERWFQSAFGYLGESTVKADRSLARDAWNAAITLAAQQARTYANRITASEEYWKGRRDAWHAVRALRHEQ